MERCESASVLHVQVGSLLAQQLQSETEAGPGRRVGRSVPVALVLVVHCGTSLWGEILYFEESLTFVTNLEKEGDHLGEPPTSGKLKRGAASEVENVAVAASVQQRGHRRRLEGKSYQI